MKLTTSNSAQDLCGALWNWVTDSNKFTENALMLKAQEYHVEHTIRKVVDEFNTLRKEYWYLKNQDGSKYPGDK